MSKQNTTVLFAKLQIQVDSENCTNSDTTGKSERLKKEMLLTCRHTGFP